MMFADANPSPQFFWQFIASIGVVLSILLPLLTYRQGQKAQKTLEQNASLTQKREVVFTGEWASKEAFDEQVSLNRSDHERLHARISSGDEKLRGEIDAARDGLQDQLKCDVDALHEKINKVDREMGQANGKLEIISQQIASVASAQQRAAERAADHGHGRKAGI